MRSYTVHLRPGADPVLVPEGFSWGALVLGPLWLLAHRAWIAAALGFAALLLAGVLLDSPAKSVIAAGAAFLLGLSGNDIRRWSLELRGYVLAHVYVARNADEALLRLLNERPDIAGSYREAAA